MVTTERVDKRRSAFCHLFFMGKKVPPVEIHRELVTVYGAVAYTGTKIWSISTEVVSCKTDGDRNVTFGQPEYKTAYFNIIKHCY
jgi:hypothetical protein